MARASKAMWMRRDVDQALIDSLKPGGPLRPLVDFCRDRPDLLDLQFRRPSGRRSRVSLYAGMTRIIDVDMTRIGNAEPSFRFFVEHLTHRTAAAGYHVWSAHGPLPSVAARWPEVKRYLTERVSWLERTHAGGRHIVEGRVHASLCGRAASGYHVLNRESSPSFGGEARKALVCQPIRDEIARVLDRQARGRSWMKPRTFGTSPDILAVDDTGRLLVIEAKPSAATDGIIKGPIQARFYAALTRRWLENDPEAANMLRVMGQQRIEVGLSRGPLPTVSSSPPVVPVLAIGPGPVSPTALERCRDVRDGLALVGQRHAGAAEPIEIWQLDGKGRLEAKL